MTTKVKRSAQKVATFHDAVISGATPFDERKRNDYVLAYDSLSTPPEEDEKWEDRYEATDKLFEDPSIT